MSNQSFWFPASLTDDAIIWIMTDSEQLSSASFLFGNVFAGNQSRRSAIASKDVSGEAAQFQRPPRYIFHTAFCCSTLLARALRFKDRTLDLKEPDALMQLANIERIRPGRAKDLLPVIQPALFSLAPETTIVKPTNAANRIIPQLMADDSAKAIIIHSDLDSFVASIARKGEEGRSFVRRLYNIFMMDDGFAQQLQPRDVFTLTDLQIAGFVWAIQCAQIQAAINENPNKYKVIHCDVFLEHPERTLVHINQFFELGLEHPLLAERAQSDLFFKNSKFPEQGFDATMRGDDKKEATEVFASSLAYVHDWVGKLPHPKSISGPSLLP